MAAGIRKLVPGEDLPMLGRFSGPIGMDRVPVSLGEEGPETKHIIREIVPLLARASSVLNRFR
jgi:hypothetical protein